MGESKLTPLTTPTPLNRQSPNNAHVIKSTISPHMPHFVKIAPGVTSPHIAKFATQFLFLCFFLRKIFQPVEKFNNDEWAGGNVRLSHLLTSFLLSHLSIYYVSSFVNHPKAKSFRAMTAHRQHFWRTPRSVAACFQCHMYVLASVRLRSKGCANEMAFSSVRLSVCLSVTRLRCV